MHHTRFFKPGPLAAVLLSVLTLLAGCAGKPVAPAASLAGTAWQLESIQSMDDAQGTLQVEDGSRFTLTFGNDGRAALRLDCNRGHGSYTAEPAADGISGSLTFGPLATTRALCPPPHLDERVARDLSYVRSYLLKDGKLFLSLMADGAIYQWTPLP